MLAAGYCYDNPAIESRIGSIKTELFPGSVFAKQAEVEREIFLHIETFYNCRCLRSVLDYLSPVEVELSLNEITNNPSLRKPTGRS